MPVAGRYSGVAIVDNDSPRPTDRVYFNYSYYDSVGAQMNPGLGNITMNRPMLGFEKTFLNGERVDRDARALYPVERPAGGGCGCDRGHEHPLEVRLHQRSHMATCCRPAWSSRYRPVRTGGVLVDGEPVPHSTLFQPWLGFVQVFDRAYVQGITGLIVPTDGRDTTLWGNSLGVGYWLYRADGDRIIQGIIPVAEVHVRTPFNNREQSGLIYLQDRLT